MERLWEWRKFIGTYEEPELPGSNSVILVKNPGDPQEAGFLISDYIELEGSKSASRLVGSGSQESQSVGVMGLCLGGGVGRRFRRRGKKKRQTSFNGGRLVK